MYVETLALRNFRNYEALDIIFSDKINILYGDNAQGKTNILESIYLSATTRSHKRAKEKDIIRFGEEESHIRLNIKKRDVGHRIDVHLKKIGNKGIAISDALKDAKEMEKIMFYLHQNSYKVTPAHGVMLSNRLLQLTVQIVDSLEDAMVGGAANEG